MKTTQRTFRRVGLVAGTSLLALAAIGPAASPALAKPSGAIWTTKEDCSDAAAQDANSYSVGETIFVRGSGFAATTAYSWTITGKPGKASGDPNALVISGSDTTNASGGFCALAYIVAADDWGEYSVEVTQGQTRKNDNYRVEAESGDDSGDEDADDGGDQPTDDPSDEPGDEQVDQPTDDPTDDPSDEPGDEQVEEPTDDPSDEPGDEQVEEPTDGPSDEPGDEQVEEPTDGSPVGEDAPSDDETAENAPPATETGNQPETDTNYSQEVLGAVGGPSITPPPSDIAVAPSGQTSGNEWRLILAFLGVLVLVATFGLPERRRAA